MFSRYLLTSTGLFICLSIATLLAPTSVSAQGPCPVGGYPPVSCPVLTDSVIAAVIESRLAGSVLTANTPLNVVVINGQVTLRGAVADSMRREMAFYLARTVRGVRCVKNELTLQGDTALDLALADMVREELSKVPVDLSQVRVDASQGVIELHGMVDSEASRFTLEQQAASVPGVVTVYNNLTVQSRDGGTF